MKVPFSLGVYWGCEYTQHLFQEQNRACQIFEDQETFQAAWQEKKLTARILVEKQTLRLETWGGSVGFPLPCCYGLIENSLHPLSQGVYYIFQRHGLYSDCLCDPQSALIKLRRKESQLLAYLMENSKVRKEELLEKVWHYAPSVGTHTLETHLVSLRQKIRARSCAPFDIVCQDSFYCLA